MQNTFLVEIGTEELPPKILRSLAVSFSKNFKNQLKQANIYYGKVLSYASPRRLGLKVNNLIVDQFDSKTNKRYKTISHIFDDKDKLTDESKNLDISCRIPIKEDECLVANNVESLFYKAVKKGYGVEEIFVNMVSNALNALIIQKLMRWGSNEIQFVRPVHTLIMLLGNKLIKGEVLGVQSNRIINGHRFMGEPKLTIYSAEQYPEILHECGKVIADYEERKTLIKYEANKIAKQLGGIVELPDFLLEEVTSLVEWPVVLTAKFEQKFLKLPLEALVHTMKYDQKYFPIYDQIGNLMTNFIFVANIESSDPQQIISGNEKVIHSRLTDAEFFFKTDCEKRLEEYLPQLETILFHKQLGTLLDKTDRLKKLVVWIADKIGADVNHAARAALLSKCDLITNMVFEFTNTQGIMGMHYAQLDGEPEDVAIAIKEHYKPCFSGDKLPFNNVSAALAIADKIDTLVGIFGINQHPKGDNDPFALRRATTGVLSIIIENSYNLDLLTLTHYAAKLYGNKLTNKNVIDDVIKFMLRRFCSWYQNRGYRTDTIKSVLNRRPTRPTDFDARVKAITHFRTLPEANSLASANKRVINILNKSNEILNENVISTLLKAPEEIILSKHLVVLEDKLAPLFATGQYQSALIELASLHEVIDNFFKNVMVMDNDKLLRINRLRLLNKLRNLFLHVADISLLSNSLEVKN